MKFCTIAPGSMLRHVETNNTHLVLPQVTNEEYINFYLERREAGDTLILDNGVYEGQFSEERLVEAIIRFDPQIVVLPDLLLRPMSETMEASTKFARNHIPLLEGRSVIMLLQGESNDIVTLCNNLKIWLEGWGSGDSYYTKCIGLPRVLTTHFNSPMLRVQIATWLRKVNPDVYIHAFGMAAGDLSELSSLASAGVDSCDSSCAVWRGYNGVSLSDPGAREWWDKFGAPVDFDAPKLPDQDFGWRVIGDNQRAITDAIERGEARREDLK